MINTFDMIVDYINGDMNPKMRKIFQRKLRICPKLQEEYKLVRTIRNIYLSGIPIIKNGRQYNIYLRSINKMFDIRLN